MLTLNGDIDEKIFNLEDDIDMLAKEQEALDLLIESQRSNYIAKFTAMETAVSSFKKLVNIWIISSHPGTLIRIVDADREISI